MFREKKIRFKFDKNIKKDRRIIYGQVSFNMEMGGWLIKVNPNDQPKEGIISTMLHECLHILYPNKEEDEIIKLEKMVYKYISDQQKENFLILAARRFKRKYNE